jgi:hypothetical protein
MATSDDYLQRVMELAEAAGKDGYRFLEIGLVSIVRCRHFSAPIKSTLASMVTMQLELMDRLRQRES